MRKDHLDPWRGKEAARTRVLANSKMEIRFVGGRELVVRGFSGSLALGVVAEGVEDVGVGGNC